MFIENLEEKNIILVNAVDKDTVLKKLCRVIFETGKVSSEEVLEEKVLHREKLMSTGIGLGVGVPHVRCEGVKNVVIAMAVSDSPIAGYDSIDGTPVRIVVMIVVPEHNHRQHILILSDIVQLLKDGAKRAAILSAHSSEEIYKSLR